MRFLLLSVLVVFLVGIMVPSAFAEITITDDATGGGCTTIGTWDSASKTCTLTSDVSEQITIGSDGITLDGNSHTITMDSSSWWIGVASTHDSITVKNFEIIGAAPNHVGISGNGLNYIISNNILTNARLESSSYVDGLLQLSQSEIFGNIVTRPDYDYSSYWYAGMNIQGQGV